MIDPDFLAPSHASALPPRAGTVHDPYRARIAAATGWRAVRAAGVVTGLAHLVERGGRLGLGPAGGPWDAEGSFGGLALPKTVARAPNGDIFLLDGHHLRVLDPCACVFVEVPGVVAGAAPVALAVRGRELLIADPGAGRVHLRDRRSMAARQPLLPPPGAGGWQPQAVAADARGQVYVGDPAGGAVHVFARSGAPMRSETGLGAVSALMIDCDGALWVLRGPNEAAMRVDLSTFARHEQDILAAPSSLFVDRGLWQGGVLHLAHWCEGGTGIFDLSGQPAEPKEPDAALVAEGTLLAGPIDSRIHDCKWDLVELDARTPPGCRLQVETLTANTERPLALVEGAGAQGWTHALSIGPRHAGRVAAPVRSGRGRWLWLRVHFAGPGVATPELCRLDLSYPRRGLEQYLPEVALAEPASADFTERFLGIFGAGQRSIEHQIDRMAALFDVDTVPSSTQASRDRLGWLARWIGVTLDRALPETLRRRLLKAARRDLGRVGTPGALRRSLLALIGIDGHVALIPGRGSCVPCKTPPSAAVELPMLVLEHFRLRRWLIAGLSRLDANSELWGQRILNQTTLGAGTRLGTTELNSYQDPRRGPFHRDAHCFSVFLPARIGADPALRRAAKYVIEAHRPAHTTYAVHYVGPRMRIGQQARLGFDSVIARRIGQEITLSDSRLGHATVLTTDDPSPAPPRLGHSMRLSREP